MRLLLIRHGATVAGPGRYIGWSDPELSQEGRDTVGRIEVNVRPAYVISSDLRRARESAEILAGRLGVDIRVDGRLREMHFGEWEGLTPDEVELKDFSRYHEWMRDWRSARVPGGESRVDLIERASSWLEELRRVCVKGSSVVVVTHAGVIQAVMELSGVQPVHLAYAERVAIDVALPKAEARKRA